MIFDFKAGSHLYGDAQKVGERLEVLRKQRSGLTPASVVADARDKRSVLHNFFDWDDASAAEKWRLDRAGHIIRCVVVVMDQEEPQKSLEMAAPVVRSTTVRAFLPVLTEDGDQVFEATAVALSDERYRQQVLARAHSELGAVARKYRELKELAEVVSAIDRVGEIINHNRLDETV